MDSFGAGKGDKPRPVNVTKETWDGNWEKAFGKGKKKTKKSTNSKKK